MHMNLHPAATGLAFLRLDLEAGIHAPSAAALKRSCFKFSVHLATSNSWHGTCELQKL